MSLKTCWHVMSISQADRSLTFSLEPEVNSFAAACKDRAASGNMFMKATENKFVHNVCLLELTMIWGKSSFGTTHSAECCCHVPPPFSKAVGYPLISERNGSSVNELERPFVGVFNRLKLSRFPFSSHGHCGLGIEPEEQS